MRLIFMGTPDFAVPSLQRLIDEGFVPISVVTGPDKERGRGRQVSSTPVKRLAVEHGIPVIQPASVKDLEFARRIADLQADLIVVVAFRILPPDVFNAASLGAFNLHASLLPAFRGAAPIQRSLMEGVDETGVTTFFLKEKVDTGNIILQKRIAVGPDETGGELHDRLAELGAEAVVETVRLIEDSAANPAPQDDSAASPAPKIAKEDCHIDWNRPNSQVHNLVRALSPYPAAFTMHDATRIKILKAMPVEIRQPVPAGTVVAASDRLVIACASGGLEVLELQREGKRAVEAGDFLRGYDIRPGQRLS